MKAIVAQLDPIFKPKSIAVIGASNRVGKWGFMVLDRPLRTGYKGAIYPVNPNEDEVLGLRCYRGILDIPDHVDLAVVTVPAPSIPQLMHECVEKGVKGAILVSAGFAEAGSQGKILQDEVLSIAREGGIRFVGPNCMGIWSATSQLNLCFQEAPDSGHIAFISQSGTFGGYLSEVASERGYGLSKFISIGNQADLTASEYLEYLAEDEETKAIVLYMEGFRDGRKFFELAKAVIKEKPIVIYKGGSTNVGARATMSHTASLAGSEEVFEGMCHQVGIIRAQETLQSFEMAEVLMTQPLLPGRRVAILGSGGQCVVTADACVSLGIEVPQLDAETTRSLNQLLPPHAPPATNPIDFAGSYRTAFEEASVTEKLLSLDYIDGVMTNVPVNPAVWGLKPSSADAAKSISEKFEIATRGAELFASLPRKYNKPVICQRFRRTDHDPVVDILRKAGVPAFDTPEQCARAMYALAKYAEARRDNE